MFVKKDSKGITLIALIITIIVLLILAGVTINTLFGNEGIITKSKLSSFATEMKHIEENVKLKQGENTIYQYTGETTELFTEKFDPNSSKYKVKDSLKQEIMYIRDGMPSNKKTSDYKAEDFNNLSNRDLIFVIDKKTGDNKENTYIWDEKSGVAFKIQQTNIAGEAYHSYECAIAQKGSLIGEKTGTDNTISDEASVVNVNGVSYYEPNLNGFDANNTYIVYYSSDYSTTKLINVKEYIKNGKQRTIENGSYTFYDYKNKTWANIVTKANGVEAWWVWTPRYSYKLNSQSSNPPISIAYTDIKNTNLNNVDDFASYIPHTAFTTVDNSSDTEVKQELKGIWMSKFNATEQSTTISSSPEKECYGPDMSGYDEDNTYMVYYTEDCSEKIEVNLKQYKSEGGPRTKEQGEKTYILYDYAKKIWANIVTKANGVEAWWVWIPRYAYNTKTVQTERMDVMFITTEDKPYNTEKVGNILPDGYEVHSAFKNTNLKGIWMSKFNATEQSTIASDDASKECYGPDMNGYDEDNTYMVYYTEDCSEKIEVSLKQYKSDGSPRTKEQGGKTYILYDYAKKVWANIVTKANGVEAWWVWIPRYAYNTKVMPTERMDIIFVTTDNKPYNNKYGNQLQDGYTVHPAFTPSGSDGSLNLKGIWMSKFNATYDSSTSNSTQDITLNN